MSNDPVLLYPAPQRRTPGTGGFEIPGHGSVTVPAGVDERIVTVATELAHLLAEVGGPGATWTVTQGGAAGAGAVSLDLAPGRHEGYLLRVDAEEVRVTGADEAGLAYGVATLRQLVRSAFVPGGRPVLAAEVIEDWPTLPHRAVMIDVSRDRVPTMDTLFRMVDDLASWKYNELQLYLEHTFAYREHEAIWRNASPLTADEIIALDAYCRSRFVTLVPNQNTLGHLHKWLEHPAYAPLAENYPYRRLPIADLVMHRGIPFWGDVPYSICPTDPAATTFVLGLLDELLPNFTARTVNIGLDEPFDLGAVRSRGDNDTPPGPRLYLEFLSLLHAHLARSGHTVQMWGDFLAEHPELIPHVPTDVVVVDWGYWEGYPFEERAARLAAAGLTFRLATGTNAWCSLGGQSEVTRVHMEAATDAALRHGAEGVIVTDWGWFEHGTYQQYPISYPGFLRGAGEAWSPGPSRAVPFAEALSRHALGDGSGELGRILIELGELGTVHGPRIVDSSPLYWAVREDIGWLRQHAGLTPQEAAAAVSRLDGLADRVAGGVSTRSDSAAILDELAITVALMRHGARRYLLAHQPDDRLAKELDEELTALTSRFERSWRRRYRSGGLAGTLAQLRALGADYQVPDLPGGRPQPAFSEDTHD